MHMVILDLQPLLNHINIWYLVTVFLFSLGNTLFGGFLTWKNPMLLKSNAAFAIFQTELYRIHLFD